MFTNATPAMWEQLKELWRMSFHDKSEYIELIFSRLLTPQGVFVALRDGAPAAMLCSMPITLRACGNSAHANASVHGAYYFGIATNPAFRGEGLSTKLLAYSEQQHQSSGSALSVLVPASESLFGFYGKRGYESDFYIAKTVFPADGAGFPHLHPIRMRDQRALRDAVFSSGRLYVEWGEDYLDFVEQDCMAYGGEVLGFEVDGHRGYAACYPISGTVLVKELVAPPELVPDIAGEIARRYERESCTVYFPEDFTHADPKSTLPFAMSKWYDNSERDRFKSGCTLPAYFAHGLD